MKNVFLIPPSESVITVENMEITPENGFFCLNAVDNKISLRIEGLGARTLVEEWPKQ